MAEFIGLETEQKKKVLEGLDRLRPEERVEVLSQALIDDNLQIRLQAVDRTERLQLSTLYSGLMWSARQPKGGLRSAVVSCFLSLPAAEFRKIVIRELGSVLTDLRLFALDLLAERGEACDLPKLIPLLGDHKIDVRDRTRRTLTRIFSRELTQRRERQEGRKPGGAPQRRRKLCDRGSLAFSPGGGTGSDYRSDRRRKPDRLWMSISFRFLGPIWQNASEGQGGSGPLILEARRCPDRGTSVRRVTV